MTPGRERRWWRSAVVLVLVAVAGCATPEPATRPATVPAPESYVVREGDTLFGIARRFGLDHHAIARWNRLGDGTLIYPGQRLRLHPAGAAVPAPVGVPATAPPAWRWPTQGRIVEAFGQTPRTASGVLIAGRPGQEVVAAADGEVVYAGSGLAGYGQLVIIRHDAAWLSAYGHNRELLVHEGERLRAGQRIASMGEGAGRDAVLHFEIRRDGAPLDPVRLLPAAAP